MKSEYLPVDKKFVISKIDEINQYDLVEFLIENFNNFPENYVHRLLICMDVDWKGFERGKWEKILAEMTGIISALSLVSFIAKYTNQNVWNLSKLFLGNMKWYNELENVKKESPEYFELDEEELQFLGDISGSGSN